jgi:hypothetical protein
MKCRECWIKNETYIEVESEIILCVDCWLKELGKKVKNAEKVSERKID